MSAYIGLPCPSLHECSVYPDQASLPRTNNGLESRFREVRRRLLRTTGQAGATVEQLQRWGAWEMMVGTTSEAEQVTTFSAVDPVEWTAERVRVRQHQARFRLHTHDPRRAEQQLDRLRQAWLALPADPTG
jgi:hypothetical protein